MVELNTNTGATKLSCLMKSLISDMNKKREKT